MPIDPCFALVSTTKFRANRLVVVPFRSVWYMHVPMRYFFGFASDRDSLPSHDVLCRPFWVPHPKSNSPPACRRSSRHRRARRRRSSWWRPVPAVAAGKERYSQKVGRKNEHGRGVCRPFYSLNSGGTRMAGAEKRKKGEERENVRANFCDF